MTDRPIVAGSRPIASHAATSSAYFVAALSGDEDDRLN